MQQHSFKLSVTTADIALILRGLRELSYKDAHQMITDFEKILLLPMQPQQKPDELP